MLAGTTHTEGAAIAQWAHPSVVVEAEGCMTLPHSNLAVLAVGNDVENGTARPRSLSESSMVRMSRTGPGDTMNNHNELEDPDVVDY